MYCFVAPISPLCLLRCDFRFLRSDTQGRRVRLPPRRWRVASALTADLATLFLRIGRNYSNICYFQLKMRHFRSRGRVSINPLFGFTFAHANNSGHCTSRFATTQIRTCLMLGEKIRSSTLPFRGRVIRPNVNKGLLAFRRMRGVSQAATLED